MHSLKIKSGSTYRLATKSEILEAASAYMVRDVQTKRPPLEDTTAARHFLQGVLGPRDYESFCVVALDNRHRAITFRELFRGTIAGATVHPREVAKWALDQNAAAVILAHNHPSGDCQPSPADELITARLREALGLFDIRVLDHLIFGGATFASMAQQGLL